MYYQNQFSQIQTANVTTKELFHNGNRYDATLFVEKSELAKKIFQTQDSVLIRDQVSEPIFEVFFSLALGQKRTCFPEYVPYVIELSRLWNVPNVENELEKQITENPNPDVIIGVLLKYPDSFPKLLEIMLNNLSVFISIPSFYEFSVSFIGKVIYPNREPPLLQDKKIESDIYNLLKTKKELEENEVKIIEIENKYAESIENLKKKNEDLQNEKKKLQIQKNQTQKLNERKRKKIEDIKGQIAIVKQQTTNENELCDSIKSSINKLKRDADKREKRKKEKIKNRRGKR